MLKSEDEKTKDCEAVKYKRAGESLYISIYAQMARINSIVFNVFFFERMLISSVGVRGSEEELKESVVYSYVNISFLASKMFFN